MKKLLAIVLSVLMLSGLVCVPVLAAENTDPVVYVTISDGDGKLVLVREKITVKDSDNDGKLTITDALYCAHEKKYTGGAAAGYVTYASEFGISLSKLWGVENGGSYGYYLNDNTAWSLTDEIKDGDCVNAFMYRDLSTWSDQYSFFDLKTASVEAGNKITLTLTTYCWNSAAAQNETVPVEGAVITVNGVATEVKTDASGKATVTLDTAGEAIISATSDALTLVPPVCTVIVNDTKTADDVGNTTPNYLIPILCGVAAVALVAVASIVLVKRRKK